MRFDINSSKFHVCAGQLRLFARQQLRHQRFDSGRRRRAAGQIIIHMNHFMHGHHALQQRRHDAFLPPARRDLTGRLPHKRAAKHFPGCQAKLIADGGHVAGHGAVAERNDGLRPRADFVEHFHMVLVADGAFNEADVHVSRIFLHIHDGADRRFPPFGRVR